MCITYVGMRWHQDALWGEEKLAEAMWYSGHAGMLETHADVTVNTVADQIGIFMVTELPSDSVQK